MNNNVLVLIFIVVVFIFGGLLYIYNPEPVEFKNPAEELPPVLCTQEVMLCPDGTYVGRTGPNCEFENCIIPPDAIFEDGTIFEEENYGDPVACTMEAKLCPDGTYGGRTGPNCEFTPCP